MDITPDLHVLESRQNDRLGWHDCLAELIDNSFDAGASRAVIEWREGKFSIEDDGKGMPDVRSAVRLGSHKRQETTALGMYGVGIKDAWLWLSNDICIKTTRGGVTTTLAVSRSRIADVDGRWVVDDPTSRPATSGEVGTRITFGPLYANRKTAQRDTLDRLAVTFMPALQAGKQIVYVKANGNRSPIAPYRLPALQESIEETFEVGGRPVSIQIGIAQEGERIQCPGFLVCYRHRVIKSSDIGTKNYNADRVTGKIFLGNGWALTPHKNDFADHNEDLEDAIFSRISHLLEKSEQMSDVVESNAIRATLESMINECVRESSIREKRPGRSEPQVGTVLPVNTGRKRRAAKVVDPLLPGSVEHAASRSRRGFQVKWAALGDLLLGKCNAETRTVFLNVENAFVAAMKRAKNNHALTSIAVGILCHTDDTMDGMQRLVIPRGDFATSWGAVMAGLKSLETHADAAAH